MNVRELQEAVWELGEEKARIQVENERLRRQVHDLDEAETRESNAVQVLRRDNERLREALQAGREFQRIFDSILFDENDGTYRLHTDMDLHNANVNFRTSLPKELK